jgi:methylmalonyl-CoA mutase N-terminal domain/subunit
VRAEAERYFNRIEELGGMLRAIESDFFRREIADAAFAYQREVDARRKLIVGVNAFQQPEERPVELWEVPPLVEQEQVASLGRIRRERSRGDVERSLRAVRHAAEQGENLMPSLLEAALARVTVGEAMNAMADVFGRYEAAVN